MSQIHSGLREGALDATRVLLRSCKGYTQFVCPMRVAAAGAAGALPYLEVATHPPNKGVGVMKQVCCQGCNDHIIVIVIVMI